MYCSNFTSFLIRHRDDIGDVVFTLHVVVGQFRQPTLHVSAVGNQDTSVYFLDLTLLVGGIFMLNDTRDIAVIAGNSAITGWVIKFYR